MSAKTSADVLIGGKIYTLSGYESEDYLQKVANYINNKINEFDEMEQFRRFPIDMKSTLVELNIADDYFKAKEQAETLEQDVKEKDKEIYGLKHELISVQINAESCEKTAAELEKENRELLLKNAKLEAALEDALLGKVNKQEPAAESEVSSVQSESQQDEELKEEHEVTQETEHVTGNDDTSALNTGEENTENAVEAEDNTKQISSAQAEEHADNTVKPENSIETGEHAETDTYTRLSNNSENNSSKKNQTRKNHNGGKNNRNFKYMNPSK